jgi:hypothetical protein
MRQRGAMTTATPQTTNSPMHDVGDLVLSDRGEWMVRPPERCNSGHMLRGRCLVGTTVCACRDRHATWTCNRCNDTVYGPALGPHCSVLHGPAPVR